MKIWRKRYGARPGGRGETVVQGVTTHPKEHLEECQLPLGNQTIDIPGVRQEGQPLYHSVANISGQSIQIKLTTSADVRCSQNSDVAAVCLKLKHFQTLPAFYDLLLWVLLGILQSSLKTRQWRWPGFAEETTELKWAFQTYGQSKYHLEAEKENFLSLTSCLLKSIIKYQHILKYTSPLGIWACSRKLV